MTSRVLALKVYALNLMTLRSPLISIAMHFDKLMRGCLCQIVSGAEFRYVGELLMRASDS